MPKNSNSFKLRFQYYKQTGKLPYKAGRVNEELATDAIQSRQIPIELQQDPLGMLRRLDIARANAANVTAMLNQAQVGPDTRTRSEIQRGNRQAAVDRQVLREALQKQKNEEAFWNLVSLTSPSTYIGQVTGLPITGAAALATDALTFGAIGALKNGFKAAVRGVKNAARERAGQNLTTPLSVATKRADISAENPSGPLSDEPLKNMERVRKEEVPGSDFDLDVKTSSREGAVPYSDEVGQFPVFKGFDNYPHLQFDFNTPANSLGEYVDRYLKSVDDVISPQITRYDYSYWRTLSDEQKLDAVSQIVTHPEYNVLFRIPKPGYKNYLKRDEGGFLDFYGDSKFKNNPNFISERPGKIILDEKELSEFLGEAPKKLRGKLTPPKLSKDRVDWTDYRETLYNKILEDWEQNGPLSAHLKRSGLTPPDVMKYMMTPELAWYSSLKNPGFDIAGHFFKMRMVNDALDIPLIRSALERSINKVLRGYNVKQPALKIEDPDHFLSRSSVVDKIADKYNLSKKHAGEAFDRAFNHTLKSDTEAAEEFFTLISENFDNAFALPVKGVMFIPANRNNFTRVVSHELGHLEDIPYEFTSSPTKGIVLSNQSYIRPSADTPLFKSAFDFSGIDGSMTRYFTGGGKDATEMAQRFTQLADELKLKPGELITPEMLEYMRDNYITLTGMNNNMEEFFKSIKNIKLAAKWGSIFHKALIPFMIGGSSLSIPQLNNTKQ